MSTLTRRIVLDRLLPFLGLAMAALVWWMLSLIFWSKSPVLQGFGPGETITALYQFFRNGEIWPHLIASLWRVLVGVGLAALIGFPMGIVLGSSPRLERSSSALLQFLRMISPLSWMPLAVMALGVGDQPVIFLLTVAAVWPLLLSAAAGVNAVDSQTLLLAKSLCATQAETVFRVILPSIIAHLITGLRLAIGIAWIVLVPAEMLGVRAGLGYYILDARDRLSYSELVAVILVIGVIGYTLDTTLRIAERLFAVRN